MSLLGGTDHYDVVVVGSGVAGLSTALGLAGRRRVAVIVGGDLGDGGTRWAQGGLAAAIGNDDSPRLHAEDTTTAGAGGCDDVAVGILTEAAPDRLAALIRLGASFDRNQDGTLALTREGGHHRNRVAHAGGDATGAEVSRTLAPAAAAATGIDVFTHSHVVEICIGRAALRPQATGVVVRRTTSSGVEDVVIGARAVVLATGGVGGLYQSTTNPPEVAGEGLGLALRAGASLVDLEFVQFHPTALRAGSGLGQLPLVTEALRGEGAVLRDADGSRIMPGHHPMADLAPRDIVARRIDEVMSVSHDGRGAQVVLDATSLGDVVLRDRFPTVYDACRRHGIDPAVDGIPVTPAQHYLCGGVRTDLFGATDVAGLYAVGEVAATGVHGANRLASNSLVEGMVFGRRLADRLASDLPASRPASAGTSAPPPSVPDSAIPALQSAISRGAGIRRTGVGLDAAASDLAALIGRSPAAPSPAAANRWLAASAIVTAAAARLESRGCHWRSDYPQRSERWPGHIVVRLGDDGVPAVLTADRLERTA